MKCLSLPLSLSLCVCVCVCVCVCRSLEGHARGEGAESRGGACANSDCVCLSPHSVAAAAVPL